MSQEYERDEYKKIKHSPLCQGYLVYDADNHVVGTITVGVEGCNDESVIQEIGPLQLQQLQRNLTRLARTASPFFEIVVDGFSNYCEAHGKLLDEKCSFRTDRSTVDMLFLATPGIRTTPDITFAHVLH